MATGVVRWEVALGTLPGLGLGQPGLGADGPLGRPELEHLAPAAERLPDGPPAVDEVAAHRLRTRL